MVVGLGVSVVLLCWQEAGVVVGGARVATGLVGAGRSLVLDS